MIRILALLASAAITAAQPVALPSLSIDQFWVAGRCGDEHMTTDIATRPSQSFERSAAGSVLFNVRSEVSAYVIVVESRYCTKSDKRRHFKIAEVPAGQCTIRAWRENEKTGSFVVKIAESTEDIGSTLEGE